MFSIIFPIPYILPLMRLVRPEPMPIVLGPLSIVLLVVRIVVDPLPMLLAFFPLSSVQLTVGDQWVNDHTLSIEQSLLELSMILQFLLGHKIFSAARESVFFDWSLVPIVIGECRPLICCFLLDVHFFNLCRRTFDDLRRTLDRILILFAVEVVGKGLIRFPIERIGFGLDLRLVQLFGLGRRRFGWSQH